MQTHFSTAGGFQLSSSAKAYQEHYRHRPVNTKQNVHEMLRFVIKSGQEGVMQLVQF